MVTKNGAHKIRYGKGDWFAVPLENGGYATGIIARTGARGKMLLGYFFGPRLHSLPHKEELAELRAEDAVLIARFGDLRLHDGTWPVIGSLDSWKRDAWPMPDFIRVDVVSGEARIVHYDPDDPSREIGLSDPQAADVGTYPEDGLYGADLVAIKLTRYLS